jgi:hypothetical protein
MRVRHGHHATMVEKRDLIAACNGNFYYCCRHKLFPPQVSDYHKLKRDTMNRELDKTIRQIRKFEPSDEALDAAAETEIRGRRFFMAPIVSAAPTTHNFTPRMDVVRVGTSFALTRMTRSLNGSAPCCIYCAE